MDLAVFLYRWGTSAIAYLDTGPLFQMVRLALFQSLVFTGVFFIPIGPGRLFFGQVFFPEIPSLPLRLLACVQFLAVEFRPVLPSRAFRSLLGAPEFSVPGPLDEKPFRQ